MLPVAVSRRGLPFATVSSLRVDIPQLPLGVCEVWVHNDTASALIGRSIFWEQQYHQVAELAGTSKRISQARSFTASV